MSIMARRRLKQETLKKSTPVKPSESESLKSSETGNKKAATKKDLDKKSSS